MPSSECMTWASTPYRSRSRAAMASAQGAWTWAPKGEWTATRQSPSSSRNRSTTIGAVVGHVAASPRAARRGRPAGCRRPTRPGRLASTRARASSGGSAPSSRRNAPSARPSSTGRPSASPFQNGSRPGRPGRGRDQDPVVGDVLDPPGGRAEGEHVADPRLVDHLLVELADPAPAFSLPARKTPNRPRSGIVPPLVTASRCAPGRPVSVPATRSHTSARAQLGELVGRVAPGEHVEHASNADSRQRGEGRGAADQRRQLVDVPGRPSRPSRRSAGRARRAGCAGSAAPRSRRRASARRPPRTARGRRGTWGRHAAGDRADLVARRGRRAAARWRPTAATRPGRRGRPRPCRCRARGCEVATTAGSRPALSSSSICARCSLDTEPWWARASSTRRRPSGGARTAAMTSAGGRVVAGPRAAARR